MRIVESDNRIVTLMRNINIRHFFDQFTLSNSMGFTLQL